MIELTKNYIDKPKFDFRDSVFDTVELIMKQDINVVILTNDLGAMGIDKIAKFASNRIINVGITEQNMVSVAAGLALSGKTVFVYGILSHIVFRAFEQIKLDVCVQNLPVIFIGVGAGLAYGVDGPTHQGIEDLAVLRALPNMNIYNPSDMYSTSFAINESYTLKKPCIVRIDKENLPQLYTNITKLDDGLILHETMQDYQGVIFSSGVTVWTSLRVKELLEQKNINFSVIDIFKIKPINKQILKNYCNNISKIIVIEESLCEGSLAELIALNIIENSKINLFRTFNLGDKYILGSAKREWAWKKYNLEALDIFNVIYKSI